MQQGFVKPCFFISCMESASELFRDKKYIRTNGFCVRYNPAGENSRRECHDTADRLMQALEFISVNGELMRGTQSCCEFADGVLNHFVHYDCYIYHKEEKIPMELLKSQTDIKEED